MRGGGATARRRREREGESSVAAKDGNKMWRRGTGRDGAGRGGTGRDRSGGAHGQGSSQKDGGRDGGIDWRMAAKGL